MRLRLVPQSSAVGCGIAQGVGGRYDHPQYMGYILRAEEVMAALADTIIY